MAAAAIALIVLAGCSNSPPTQEAEAPEPTPEPTSEAPSTPEPTPPETLALADPCPGLGAAVAAIDGAARIGPDAIRAMEALRHELPAPQQAHADTILELYDEIEAGVTDVLLDPNRVAAATMAGDALADHLATACDLTWTAS